MTDLLHSEQDIFNSYSYTDPFSIEYYCNPAFESFLTIPLQNTPGITRYNALGLYGNCEPVSDLAVDSSTCKSTTEIDSRSFGSTFFSQLSDTSAVITSDWQQLAPSNLSFPSEVTLSGIGGDFLPCLTELPERRTARIRTRRSLDNRVSETGSTIPSTSRPLRHTPYPLSTRRCTSLASVYECQWSIGGTWCGALVTGTKNAIGKHLHDAHAIRLKADKTDLECLWEGCQRSMRRESLARHILAVHMRNKVVCPTCGSCFARTDSLQRHQRTQCLLEKRGSDVRDVEE